MDAAENGGDEEVVDLPPGFRFHPTDEEIISQYLVKKVVNGFFSSCAIGEVDLNKCEPWDLPKRAKMGEKEWYFFCQKDRKYPTGMRTNRATESGYWKATGKDKEIFRGRNCLVGMKKTLVFYKGRAPKGEKSNWVMHEFRLDGDLAYYNLAKPSSKDEWVVCRVFHKNTGVRMNPSPSTHTPGPIPSFIRTQDDHDGDDGVGNQYQYQFPSDFAMDGYYDGGGISSYMPRGTQEHHHLAMVSPSENTTSSSAVSGGFYAYEDPERPSVDPISDILEYSWD